MHHTSTPLGYIMLYIDESQLSRYIFTDVSFGEGSNFLLIDAAGNVVSSQNAELLGEDLADDPISSRSRRIGRRVKTTFYVS